MTNKISARLTTISLAALGIVYGDIGTSPLYALKESFRASQMVANEANILGFISLIVWSLLLIVTLKYVCFILKADNKGEGGVVVLMQKALNSLQGKPAWVILMMGLTGTALFYGDAMITPAVSVLSAAEGLTVIRESFRPWIMPMALAILFMLFFIQKQGTHKIGILFGPIMLLWFIAIALIGLYQMVQAPRILLAFNPYYAIHFTLMHGYSGLIGLGCIVLAVTGAEALYADMGHFGRKPIQIAWFYLVLPCLLLNYLGQGALLLHQPAAVNNPFFLSTPHWFLLPLIILATLATIIASQAVIAGAFSLTRQAIQLGFLPRMNIIYTNHKEMGQIYIPLVNWLLLTAVTLVILAFHDSEHLASAYGIAVTGTMLITSLLFYVVMRYNWHWPLLKAAGLTALFLCFDTLFFGANLLKLIHGGWFPVLVALCIVTIFTSWRRGQQLLYQHRRQTEINLNQFIHLLQNEEPQQVSGNAVFMVEDLRSTPRALLHNLKHNKILHEHNIILSIKTNKTPYVDTARRISMKPLDQHFTRVIAYYGFQETPNIDQIMTLMAQKGMALELMDTSFFLSHDSITVRPKTEPRHMGRMRTRLFKWLYKNSTPVTDYYHIPTNRTVVLGVKVSL